jgi:hypothetical protein
MRVKISLAQDIVPLLYNDDVTDRFSAGISRRNGACSSPIGALTSESRLVVHQ